MGKIEILISSKQSQNSFSMSKISENVYLVIDCSLFPPLDMILSNILFYNRWDRTSSSKNTKS